MSDINYRINEIVDRLDMVEMSLANSPVLGFNYNEFTGNLSQSGEVVLGDIKSKFHNPDKIDIIILFEAKATGQCQTYLKLNNQIIGNGVIFSSPSYCLNFLITKAELNEGELEFGVNFGSFSGDIKNIRMYLKGNAIFVKNA